MNILNLKRQVAGYMPMCGGGGSDSGGGSNHGDVESGKGYSNKSYEEGGAVPSTASTTDESDQSYQSNWGQPMYGADASTEPSYRSNDGQPMYDANTSTESAPTGISSGGDYSGYTTGTGYTNGDVSNAAPYAKDMPENEKNARSVVGKVPLLGQLASTVEQFGKLIQPSGSILKRGEIGGYGGSSNGGEDYIDEDGNPITKKPTGLINSSGKPSPVVKDFINNPQQQSQQPQQSYAPQKAAVPVNAGGGVDASMYGSGSGWGASIAKFTKAKQGVSA